ncbi:DUF3800 domain-containing protein [Rhizobium sp. IY2]|uniref:DUF3800 domain-containing protein n=1 Tax=Rhizobium sp. IY2 TaxID=3397853 RepID=UPI0039E0B9F3
MGDPTIPDYEFIAYIDESGDPGLKRVRPVDEAGSTEWLVISAVLVRRYRDDETKAWVTNLNNAVGRTHNHVIHFKDLDEDQKLTMCHEIAKLPVRIFCVASNKKNMRGYTNEKAASVSTKQWFYNWIVRILIERVTDFCLRFAEDEGLQRRHVKFVFSQTGGHSYSQTAAYHDLIKRQARGKTIYLNKWSPRWEVMSFHLVENYPHYQRAGLQLADVAASAFYQAVDNLDTGPCRCDYAEALSPRVAHDAGHDKRDYGLVLQPTRYWEANLSADQERIFRFYGYKFKKKW